MDKQFLRKYFMSKLDSAQREVEILKGAVASLDADNETAEETSEEEVAAPSKKAAAKAEAKSSKKSAKKVEEVEETEAEAEETTEESDDDMFADEDGGEDDQPTVDDVRKIVKSFATKFGKDAALKLLKKFKATAIPELKKNEYAKVIELANRHLKK